MICQECWKTIESDAGIVIGTHQPNCSKLIKHNKSKWRIFDGVRASLNESYPTLNHSHNQRYYNMNRGFK